MKADVIKALRQLREAHVTLTDLLLTDKEVDISMTDSLNCYPYHTTLDEINVPLWCNEFIKELTGIVPDILDCLCIGCRYLKAKQCNGEKVSFNREYAIKYLLADDLLNETDRALGQIYNNGLEGYNSMEDFEIYQYYIERVEQYASNDG